MYRGRKVYFTASQAVIQQLFACNRISAEIWNACLHEAKQHHISTGKWINQTQLQQVVKGKFPLHSQSVQAICHKYLFSRDSMHQAKKKGIGTARYPYRRKKYFNTKWVDQAFRIHTNGKVELSLGVQGGKRQKPLVLFANNLPSGDIKEIELCFDKKLYLSVTYDDGQTVKPPTGIHCAGVDLGEIHAIASVSEIGEGILLSGRKLRSIHRLRNKKVAQLQRLMSKCKKGSRQWKRYRRAKQYILAKSERQLQDGSHKITKAFVDWCVVQSIKELFIGNVGTVSKGTKKKRKLRRRQRQKMSNWNVGQQIKYLTYKCESQSIVVTTVSEVYSTQTCPVCKKRQKAKGRIYKCLCGYVSHRDTHGAKNILSEQLYGTFTPIEENCLKILRVA